MKVTVNPFNRPVAEDRYPDRANRNGNYVNRPELLRASKKGGLTADYGVKFGSFRAKVKEVKR